MQEIWKDINGYEGLYQISNLGNVRSMDRIVTYSNGKKVKTKGKLLKPTIKKNGYCYVSLSKNGEKPKYDVHRLVAKAFLDNPCGYPVVNHIDGCKTNNMVSNLEWTTYEENIKHAFKNGLNKGTRGSINGQAILTESDVIQIKKLLKTMTGREIAKQFNVSESTISLIKNKTLWKHI